jgi:hypothetical protein
MQGSRLLQDFGQGICMLQSTIQLQDWIKHLQLGIRDLVIRPAAEANIVASPL